MTFDFLSPWMLAGLAGAAIPVIAHLLSRRRFEVVEWGAMQFLDVGNRTKRRLRLEGLLLLILRILMIGLIAMAFARPWAKGGVFARFLSQSRRDVVIVLDGSYSMNMRGDGATPRSRQIQQAHELLEQLSGGDRVALIDARQRPDVLIDEPTIDHHYVRQLLDELPEAHGSSNLPAAMGQAVNILSTSTQPDRIVMVLSDDQRYAWRPDNSLGWRQIDELVAMHSSQPQIKAVRYSQTIDPTTIRNFAVEKIRLSRETLVPGYPLTVRTSVRNTHPGQERDCRVSLEVDGRLRSEETFQLRIPPESATEVEFEVRLQEIGSHRIGVIIEEDDLPDDNRAYAVAQVRDNIPLLIVDGDQRPQPKRSESFFVQAALSATINPTPWVKAKTVTLDQIATQTLSDYSVILLANVGQLSDEQRSELADYVTGGGTLIVAPGDQIDPAEYVSNGNPANDNTSAQWRFPVEFIARKDDPNRDDPDQRIRPLSDSLTLPWLSRFRDENCVDFDQVHVYSWWELKATQSAMNDQPDDASEQSPQAGPTILARLNNLDPLLVSQTYGAGKVLVLSIPLDGDWTNLPALNDFVPFLHEMLFYAVGEGSGRNLSVGESFTLTAGDWNHGEISSVQIIDPTGERHPLKLNDEGKTLVEYGRTSREGFYELSIQPDSPDQTVPPQWFAVQADRRESDPALLNETDRELVGGQDRLQFMQNLSDLKSSLRGDDAGTELWRSLLFIFLGLLIFEIYLTRQLVRGGHEVVDVDQAITDSEAGESPQSQTEHGPLVSA